ncbi:MAG: hypothetical protein ACD_24C00505G0003 [uncultured bacterium]|nr:MAG: hypothetical protein ACD_24C00505G0003 [uncultured bacterium]
MEEIKEIIKLKSIKSDKRNKYEFQAYGNRLAEELGDLKHRALYIKLAKQEDRKLLELAREYVLASKKATTKGKLFMWQLTELKKKKLPSKSK